MGIDWDAYVANESLGIDPLTSLAGSMEDVPPAPRRGNRDIGSIVGLLAALALITWLLTR